MNIQQPKIDLKDNFELYIEGMKVSFISVSISESEGTIPSASISFPSSAGVLRLLPGTIIQIFGYHFRNNSTYLLFEGELTAINFQKTDSMQIVTIKAISLLGSMIKAKFRPSDAIITKELKDNTGIQASENIVHNPHGQEGANGQSTVEDFNKIKTPSEDKSVTIEGKPKDIGLTAMLGLTDEFKRFLADDQPGGKGDFIPMLQKFNKYFENNDLFYGLKSLAYKFGRSLFAAPNPELMNKIKTDLFWEALNTLQSNGISDAFGENPYTLMQVMSEFQRYLHYSFISPANYTACKPFYLDVPIDKWEPLRIIYAPRLEIGPPALCNVFFPEQVSSYTYSREMMNEPTRVVGKATVPLMNSANKVVDFSPTAVYPELVFDEKLAVGNFTTEETYRGINYKITTYSNLQSDMVSKLTTDTKDGKKTTKDRKITKDEMEKGEIGQLIRPFAYMDYLNMKYQDRQTSINAEWSPYRMIGLPGMILCTEGVSIVGVVYQIQTDISAQGSALSRITLRNTRIVQDAEFEKTVFSKIPDNNLEDYSKYVIHDLTNDGMGSTNELLYDQDLYSFQTIGRDIYTYIVQGKLSPNGGFLKAKKEKGIFSYSNDRLESNDIEIQNTRFDESVLNYLELADVKTNTYKFTIPEVYTRKTEITNTYLLYRAISKLREEYDSKKYKIENGKKIYDMDKAYDFIYSTNRRNVITKDQYFNFIGADIGRTNQTDDAHDAKIIFQDGAQALREELQSRQDLQYSAVITTTNSEKESVKFRIKQIKKEISILTNNGSYKDEKTFITKWEKQGFTGKPLNDYVAGDLAKFQIKQKELETEQAKLVDIKTTTTTTTKITKDGEMYKPYNMTRRMHTILGLKDSIEFESDNKNFKLKVLK